MAIVVDKCVPIVLRLSRIKFEGWLLWLVRAV